MTTFTIENIALDDPRVSFVETKPAGWAGEVPVKEVFAALKAHEIPEDLWPSEPSDSRCIERALNQFRTQRSLVRPLPKGKGWSLTLEYANELDLDTEGNRGEAAYRVDLTVKVDRQDHDGHCSTIRITPADHPLAGQVREAFKHYRGEEESGGIFVAAQDLSQWFSRVIIPWCRGVATRSRGGSYYVLRGEYLERLIRVSKVLEDVSVTSVQPVKVAGTCVNLARVERGGRIIIKPEFATAAAVEILIDNVIAECDKTCDSLVDKLSEDVGSRGLETQKQIAQEMADKLAEYEALLGTNLEDVRNRLFEIQANIGMASMKLLAESEDSYGQV